MDGLNLTLQAGQPWPLAAGALVLLREMADEGIDRVFAASGGVPRVVNVICDRALHLGSVRRVLRIGPDLVATAVADLRMAVGAEPAPGATDVAARNTHKNA